MSGRYLGQIVNVPEGNYGFIGRQSISAADGRSCVLVTLSDLFIHRDDCDVDLAVGMMVEFEVTKDLQRGEGRLRAINARYQAPIEILPKDGEITPGFKGGSLVRVDPDLALRKRALHAKMKAVPEAEVARVRLNNPLEGMSRDETRVPTPDEAREYMRLLLLKLFPTFGEFSANFDVLNADDQELDAAVEEVRIGYIDLGMNDMAGTLLAELEKFRSMRMTLRFLLEHDLVREQTLIPMNQLPDLFMACPVWYFYTNEDEARVAESTWRNEDPSVPTQVKFMCELIKNQRWANLFQLWNRRVRPLAMYRGEQIPPAIMRRIRAAREHFDCVVIATCYHDVAGNEWQNPTWLRGIDPYVYGFKGGLPCAGVLGRFSDTGTFPLHEQLVADTVQFLRQNKDRLLNFNNVVNPYWYPNCMGNVTGKLAGNYLIEYVDDLLAAFDRGQLFSWLRGEEQTQQSA